MSAFIDVAAFAPNDLVQAWQEWSAAKPEDASAAEELDDDQRARIVSEVMVVASLANTAASEAIFREEVGKCELVQSEGIEAGAFSSIMLWLRDSMSEALKEAINPEFAARCDIAVNELCADVE